MDRTRKIYSFLAVISLFIDIVVLLFVEEDLDRPVFYICVLGLTFVCSVSLGIAGYKMKRYYVMVLPITGAFLLFIPLLSFGLGVLLINHMDY